MSARFFNEADWEKVAIRAEFKPKRMAIICGISVRQLERHFATAFGKSPKVWLRGLRCGLAMDLLVKGHSNKEIAATLHFGSSSHFCHDFRKIFPASPQRTVEAHFRGKMSQISNECRL